MIQQSHPKDWVGRAANLPMALLGNLETGRKGENAADSWSSTFCEFTWGHGNRKLQGQQKGTKCASVLRGYGQKQQG